MADNSEDNTRDIIADAESLLNEYGKKGKKGSEDDTASRLVAEADGLLGKGKKGGADLSTRQLLVDAEKLIAQKQQPVAKKSGTYLIGIIIGGLAAAGIAAAYFLLGRG